MRSLQGKLDILAHQYQHPSQDLHTLTVLWAQMQQKILLHFFGNVYLRNENTQTVYNDRSSLALQFHVARICLTAKDAA